MAVTIDNSLIRTGPGEIYIAPLGTDLPTMVAADGTYAADAWPVGWLPAGPTAGGFAYEFSIDTEDVEVEESYLPARTEVTSQTITASFELVNDTIRVLKWAMNGGSPSTVSGAGATLSTKFTMPTLGAQVRWMVAHETTDHKLRDIFFQCLQVGSVNPSRRKGGEKTTYAMEWRVEQPDPAVSTVPFARFEAGVVVV